MMESGFGVRDSGFVVAVRACLFEKRMLLLSSVIRRESRTTTHGPSAAAGWSSRCRRQRGFTLIEVLLATVLLAAGLALAFASLRAATGTTQRGDAIARHSEQMRAVEGFLRRRIGGARPIAFGSEPDTGMQLRFSGDEQQMQFVADLPDYLGRGGPFLHELTVEDGGDGQALMVGFTMVQMGLPVEERDPRPPEALVSGMQDIRFRYRGFDDQGALGEWQDRWENHETLPLQVEVVLRDGDGRYWPAMVVALPLGYSHATLGGMLQ